MKGYLHEEYFLIILLMKMYNTKEIVLNVFNTFANEEKAYYLERIVYKNLDNITLKKDVSNV